MTEKKNLYKIVCYSVRRSYKDMWYIFISYNTWINYRKLLKFCVWKAVKFRLFLPIAMTKILYTFLFHFVIHSTKIVYVDFLNKRYLVFCTMISRKWTFLKILWVQESLYIWQCCTSWLFKTLTHEHCYQRVQDL